MERVTGDGSQRSRSDIKDDALGHLPLYSWLVSCLSKRQTSNLAISMKNMETKYVNEAKKDSRRFYDDLFYQYKGSWPVYALTIKPCSF